jgi:hypothetical protein
MAQLSAAQGSTLLLLFPYLPDLQWLFDRPDIYWYLGRMLYFQDATGDRTNVLTETEWI